MPKKPKLVVGDWYWVCYDDISDRKGKMSDLRNKRSIVPRAFCACYVGDDDRAYFFCSDYCYTEYITEADDEYEFNVILPKKLDILVQRAPIPVRIRVEMQANLKRCKNGG